MATILTKRSNTASSVPVAGDLTNSTGGAELAVNTADKRLFTKDSGGTVVELGTNPSSLSLPNGTANAVPYLNGSKVLTSGSALTFDGTNLTVTNGSIQVANAKEITWGGVYGAGIPTISASAAAGISFYPSGSTSGEQMRLTSTGLGIGTSSPSGKLDVTGSVGTVRVETTGNKVSFTRNGANYISAAGGSSASISYDAPVHYFNSGDGATTRMTLNDSGNLGLGVTPSAWSGVSNVFQLRGNAYVASTTHVLNHTANGYFNGSNWIYTSSNYASQTEQVSGSHVWKTAPSGTAGNTISFTQAMTLDASGNLLVGTTTSGGAYATFGNSSAAGASRWAAMFGTNSSSAGSPSSFGLTVGWNYSAGGGENNIIYGTSAGSTPGLAFSSYNGTTITERARIDSSGNLLVGTTSTPSSSVYGSGFIAASESRRILMLGGSSTAESNRVEFYNPNGQVGRIATNGSSTSYVTSSDYRLKENIQPMTGALAKVQALKPCTYKWNADGSDGEGFIAHELAEVCPQAVSGEKDAVDADGNPVYQGIDTSFLVATLTAAIQEQQAIINAQQAALDSLKARLDAANL